MAKYITFENLTQYDGLIKNYVDVADSKSFKSAKFDAVTRNLSLYKTESTTGDADFTVEIPETDVSDLLEKLTGATTGNVVIANANGTISDGGVKLADLAAKAEVTTVSNVANANKTAIESINNVDTGILAQAKTYTDSKDTSIAAAKKAGDDAQTDVDALEDIVGDVAGLQTTAKTDLVSAINEVRNSVSAGGVESAVTCDTSITTEGYLKSYTIKQGSNTICTIDIPKDLFVSSAQVVTNPTGQTTGTYIEMVIANQADPLYINVGTLVDIYTAQTGATQVQLTVNNSTREISAVIVDGSVDADALATNAVTTVKIADANVTLAKLSNDAKNAFDASGSASAAQQNAQKYADSLNDTMTTRVDTIEAKIPEIESISEDEIASLFN